SDACKLLRIALSAVETTSWSRATMRAAVDVIASTHFCVLVTRASGSGLVPVLTSLAPGLNRSGRKRGRRRGAERGTVRERRAGSGEARPPAESVSVIGSLPGACCPRGGFSVE